MKGKNQVSWYILNPKQGQKDMEFKIGDWNDLKENNILAKIAQSNLHSFNRVDWWAASQGRKQKNPQNNTTPQKLQTKKNTHNL